MRCSTWNQKSPVDPGFSFALFAAGSRRHGVNPGIAGPASSSRHRGAGTALLTTAEQSTGWPRRPMPHRASGPGAGRKPWPDGIRGPTDGAAQGLRRGALPCQRPRGGCAMDETAACRDRAPGLRCASNDLTYRPRHNCAAGTHTRVNPCSWRKTWVHRPAAQPGPPSHLRFDSSVASRARHAW